MILTNKKAWLLFVGIALSSFMGSIDFLGIAVAIEPMAKELLIDIATLQWIVTAFAIGNSSFLVTSGQLADLYGRKSIYISGLLLFVLTSITLSITSSALVIILARLVQGASLGIMVTTAISILISVHDAKNRPKWISGLVGIAGLGMAIGPVLGGYLVNQYSWRMLFLINVPIGIIGFVLAMLYIPKQSAHEFKQSLDIKGIIFFTATLVLFTIGISQGENWGWLTFKTNITFLLSFILLIIFIQIEKYCDYPLVDFSLFKIQNFLAANILGFIAYFSLTAWILIFGIYLQRTVNMSAQESGMALLPFGIGVAAISIFAKKLTIAFSAKKLIMIGYILSTIAFIGMSTLSIHPASMWMIILFLVYGASFSLVNSNSIPAALEFIPANKSGISTGKSLMIRWLGGAIGAAVVSTIFMIVASLKIQNLTLQSSELSKPAVLLLLHAIVAGKQPVTQLRLFLHGDQIYSAQQWINESYHYGLIICMKILGLISFAALFICGYFIKKKNDI